MNLKTKLYSDLGKRGAARNVWSCSLARWTSCDSEGNRVHRHQATSGKLKPGM